MQYGPQEVRLLTPTEKRFVLMRQFPEWFNNDGNFVRDGYLAWANQYTGNDRLAWLGLLKPAEIASVTNCYSIWFQIHKMKNAPSVFPTIRDWIKLALPFWLDNNKFDAIGFTAWYGYADFKDQEEVFRHLTLEEQKDILKIWAMKKTIVCHHAYKTTVDLPDTTSATDEPTTTKPLFLRLNF